ncbi:MAG: DUF4038 domain-containing protein [Acidimicrobiia bacterium]|nr:DUF4038 domain-containing protein [Acidimicrobiia bacterium]
MRTVVAAMVLALFVTVLPAGSADALDDFELFDTAWALPNKATPSEVETYFDHLANGGFDGVWIMMSPHYWQGGMAAETWNGQAMQSFSNPNPGYLAHMDYLFNEAAERGLELAVAIAWAVDYAGTRPGIEGKPTPAYDDWFDPDDPNVGQKAFDYGFLLGSRWKGHPGLHSWVLGGDYWDGSTEASMTETYEQMAAGLTAAGATEPVTYGPGGFSSSWEIFANAPWVDYLSLNAHCYSPARLQSELENLGRHGKPVVAAEIRYEAEVAPWCVPPGEDPEDYRITGENIRDDVIATVASGASGYVLGHNFRWAWDPPAIDSLGSPGEQYAREVLGLTDPPPPPTGEVVLVEPNGLWHVRVEGQPDWTFWYGNPGDTPLFGDWDGDGVSTPGMYRPSNGFAYLTNTLPDNGSAVVADPGLSFFYGIPGDRVFFGDWDGDGKDSLGIQRNGKLFLRNSNSTGIADLEFWFGQPDDQVFGGNSGGNDADEIFIFRPSTGMVYYTNGLPSGGAATTAGSFGIGSVDDLTFGDWNGDDIDTVGMQIGGVVRLKNSNTAGPHDIEYTWGDASWMPVAGILDN